MTKVLITGVLAGASLLGFYLGHSSIDGEGAAVSALVDSDGFPRNASGYGEARQGRVVGKFDGDSGMRVIAVDDRGHQARGTPANDQIFREAVLLLETGQELSHLMQLADGGDNAAAMAALMHDRNSQGMAAEDRDRYVVRLVTSGHPDALFMASIPGKNKDHLEDQAVYASLWAKINAGSGSAEGLVEEIRLLSLYAGNKLDPDVIAKRRDALASLILQ